MQHFFKDYPCKILNINKEELKEEKLGPTEVTYLYECNLTYECNGKEKVRTWYFPKDQWENEIKPQMTFMGR